jgi:hypothetical protein
LGSYSIPFVKTCINTTNVSRPQKRQLEKVGGICGGISDPTGATIGAHVIAN